jgi:hypothetical protein
MANLLAHVALGLQLSIPVLLVLLVYYAVKHNTERKV